MNTPNGGKPAMATVPINSPQPTVGWVRIRPRIFSMRLGAGDLGRVTDGDEDRGLGERVHGHVQQRAEGRERPADAEGEGHEPHVLDGRVAEHALDVALAVQEQPRDHERQQAEAHHEMARQVAVRSEPSTSILTRTSAYSATLSSSPESIADIGVGPSECASGSQLCSGTRPTLVP